MGVLVEHVHVITRDIRRLHLGGAFLIMTRSWIVMPDTDNKNKGDADV